MQSPLPERVLGKHADVFVNVLFNVVTAYTIGNIRNMQVRSYGLDEQLSMMHRRDSRPRQSSRPDRDIDRR